MKKYQIKTLQDMIECTNDDNLDNFLIDLKKLIIYVHEFQNINNLVAEITSVPKELAKIKADGFTWIDDGKHHATIRLGVKH